MNPFEQIPNTEIQFFKERVKRWLNVDQQIAELEKQKKLLIKIILEKIYQNTLLKKKN